MKIVYTPAAKNDLADIKRYISSELNNPSAAMNVTAKVIKEIHNLSDFPKLGISIQEKTDCKTDARCLICGNYGVIYTANHKIEVLRIIDMRTDYMSLIFNTTKES